MDKPKVRDTNIIKTLDISQILDTQKQTTPKSGK